jgi:hypothetical protein
MEQDNLKSAWQTVITEPKGFAELNNMIREKGHPVLKAIRKQLIIEIAAFALFLIVYYDFFDGDKKPGWANMLLVIAMSFVILYNFIGHWLTKRRIKGHNIKQSLVNHINKMRIFAIAFVISRTLAATCLLIYFSSVITFNAFKYWILMGMIVTLILLLVMLSKRWWQRINRLKKIVDAF